MHLAALQELRAWIPRQRLPANPSIPSSQSTMNHGMSSLSLSFKAHFLSFLDARTLLGHHVPPYTPMYYIIPHTHIFIIKMPKEI